MSGDFLLYFGWVNYMASFWKKRNVFITGATGLLGSWLTKYLIEGGANVICLVRDSVPHSNFIASGYMDKAVVVRGDLSDLYLLERILGEYEIDTVFHVAAQTIVSIANRNPLSTFESNIRGSWNVFEACRRSSLVKRVVVASSDKAYGIHKKLPYSEDASLQGRYPYDVSKSAVDLIARCYYETYQLPVAVTRCGNLFGGGDLNFNRIIPGTIQSIINNSPPIIRSNGKYVRDYFYVEDAALAYLMLAERMEDEKIHGHAFNFSNEIQMSVINLAKLIIKIMDSKLKPKILNEVKNEIPHQYLSAEKARKVLNWKPKFSLEDGLARTIDWYKKLLV